jgi:hypothetical protein
MSANPTDVRVACCYRRCWEDGFGARGWKLAVATGDPEVIASTAETGRNLATSVLVHDILDHHLCRLGASGHRNEAVALIQLAARTGADPASDFAQMVDEDLMQGRAVGESLIEFLPRGLIDMVPATVRSGELIVGYLTQRLGDRNLRRVLIDWLFVLGHTGASRARECYEQSGLDYQRRGPLGLAVQKLLASADTIALEEDWASGSGEVWIRQDRCGFQINNPRAWESEVPY